MCHISDAFSSSEFIPDVKAMSNKAHLMVNIMVNLTRSQKFQKLKIAIILTGIQPTDFIIIWYQYLTITIPSHLNTQTDIICIPKPTQNRFEKQNN